MSFSSLASQPPILNLTFPNSRFKKEKEKQKELEKRGRDKQAYLTLVTCDSAVVPLSELGNPV